MTYRLYRPLSAIVLREEFVTTELPAGSFIDLRGPCRRLEGLIEIECDKELYAVFMADVEERGSKVEMKAPRSSMAH
jgi:hypothetical protein